MEHVIVSAIMAHAENNNILRPGQHGFRRGRSCETQLLGFIDEVTEDLEKGNQVDVLVLDFSKALDKVSHCLLIHRLQCYGITGKLNASRASYMTGAKW